MMNLKNYEIKKGLIEELKCGNPCSNGQGQGFNAFHRRSENGFLKNVFSYKLLMQNLSEISTIYIESFRLLRKSLS